MSKDEAMSTFIGCEVIGCLAAMAGISAGVIVSIHTNLEQKNAVAVMLAMGVLSSVIGSSYRAAISKTQHRMLPALCGVTLGINVCLVCLTGNFPVVPTLIACFLARLCQVKSRLPVLPPLLWTLGCAFLSPIVFWAIWSILT